MATPDTPDMSLVYQRSALIVSTGHPLMQILREDDDTKKFVAFTLLAGGAIQENPREPQEKDYIKFHSNPYHMESWYPDEGCFVRKSLPTNLHRQVNTSLNELLRWASTTLDKLPTKEKEYLSLVSARLILFDLIDQKIIAMKHHSKCTDGLIPASIDPNLIPDNLKQAMVEALFKHKLIRKKDVNELFTVSESLGPNFDEVAGRGLRFTAQVPLLDEPCLFMRKSLIIYF